VLRSIWPRLWVLSFPLLLGGVLWSQVSTKPPLATPPPEVVSINTPAATATRRPTATPSPTHTPVPSPTPTATPEPTAPAPTQVMPVPTQTVTPSPAPPVEGHGFPEALGSLPAVVRLGADARGRYILIDQATQIMHVFEGWREIRTCPVSTGLPDLQTQTPEWTGSVGEYVGSFRSFGTYQDHGWYLFSRGGDILLHGAPYTVDEAGHKVYREIEALGQRPASHGCIRLAPEDADWLTAWNPQGVPVTITGWPFGEPGRESDYDEEGVG
jgi:lipoprotein-anchoring transpeptidase ErfK/SrfK